MPSSRGHKRRKASRRALHQACMRRDEVMAPRLPPARAEPPEASTQAALIKKSN